jgi:ABC-2 type transport system permease protein
MMHKTWKILRYELISAVSRRSYLLIAFGVPLIAVLIFGSIEMFRDSSSPVDEQDSSSLGPKLEVEGFVDQGDLIQVIPPDLSEGILIRFEDEESARQAYDAGEISAYYIIPPDHLESGEFIYVPKNMNPFTGDEQDWVMRWILLVNTLGGDIELATRVGSPVDLTITTLAPSSLGTNEDGCTTPGYSCESQSPLLTLLPLLMVVLFLVFVSNGAGILLRSVSSEKQNRTMEVLLSSISPRQMLTGKFIALGIVSLVPTAMYMFSIYTILRIGGNTLQIPPGFSVPTSIITWTLVFFLLGYAVYASLEAGVGALFPTQKEATQASFVVLLPLMVGYFLAIMPFTQEDPHGILATILSIFPLTAPVMMVMRLTVGGVPLWQILLAILLMLFTTVLVMRAAARIFHTQVLLSGQQVSIGHYLKVLFARV